MSQTRLETRITSLIELAWQRGCCRETGWRAPVAKKHVTPQITQQRSERSACTSTDFAVPSKGSARQLGPAASFTTRTGERHALPQSISNS